MLIRTRCGVLIVLVVLLAGLGTVACSGSSGPAGAGQVTTVAAAAQAPAAGCLDAEEVSSGQVGFRSADGSPLQGLLLGDGPVGVVLAHQSGDDLCEWKPYAYSLAARHYRVLAFNFGTHLDQDVAGAAAQLRAKGSTSIVLIGASMGGTAVLGAAVEIVPPVSAVISLSGPGAFGGVDALSTIGRLRVPVLFVAGENDHPFVDDARTMYAATKAPGRRLLIAPSGDHGVALLPIVQTAMEKFFQDRTAAAAPA